MASARQLRTAPVVLAAVLAACAGAPVPGSAAEQQLLVSASASLTDAFTDVAAAFERANPGVDVVLNLAGSSTLREQILAGAPADVFASADPADMDALVMAGVTAGAATVVATNRLTIAVPAGNPAGVTGLADLADGSRFVGLCAETVACGRYARAVLAAAGVAASVDTNEPDVRALLTKIAAGELDAGIVYVTDVLAARPDVESVAIPDAVGVTARYPVAVLRDAPSPGTATAFVAFVASDEGRRILRAHGFGAP